MSDQGHFGQRGLPDATDDINVMDFMIRQALGQTRTMVPVRVVAVHGGGVDRPPTIDVQPLIKQTNGVGDSYSHGIVYGIPVARSQSGGSAIIMDPSVDDVGIMSIADRDISSLKENNGAESLPGSRRTFDMADGVYHGPMLNAAPTQYVQFTPDGIVIQTPGSITLNGVTITPAGDIIAPGQITSEVDDITLSTHNHGGPPPTPGS